MRNISGKTKIFGVVGYPIKHTLSPAIHNNLFKKFELDCIYLPFEVLPGNFGKFFNGLKSTNNFVGLNITVPFKNVVTKYIDKLPVNSGMPISSLPINTVHFKKEKSYGYNTDIYGFKKALLKNYPNFNLKNKNVLLLGAGGASQAVAISLLHSKIKKLVIANRTFQKAKNLSSYLKKNFKLIKIEPIKLTSEILSEINEKFHLIINATSVGLRNEKSIINFSKIKEKDVIVYDLIYNPPMTDFLLQAKKKRLKILNGLDMLIFQAFRAFQIWTGKNPEKFYTEILKIIRK